MRIDYPEIRKTIAALTEGETDPIALMAAGVPGGLVTRST